jgi:hypothetical protein
VIACYPGKSAIAPIARRSRTAKHVPIEQQQPDGSSSRRDRLLTPAFSARRHLGTLAALAVAELGVAGWLVREARAADLWIVPAYLLVANVVEYVVHRVFMHRPLWPRVLYRGHTLGHHRAFHHDSMEIGRWRELELVVMPWFTIVLIFAGMAPLVALVAWGLGRGAAGLLLLTGVGSFVLYEGLHTLYHFPSRTQARLGLDRNRVFQFLLRHHRHHHRLTRMRWVNFNISAPLADRLFGTFEDERAWQRERDRQLAEPVGLELPASPRRSSGAA